MKVPINSAIVLGMLLVLGGCVSLRSGSSAPQSYFVLADARIGDVTPRDRPIEHALLLVASQPDALADARALTFSRTAGERSFYQFASWSDRPSRSLLRLIQERLTRRAAFRSVAMLGEGVRGELILQVRIEGFFHDLTDTPNTSRIVFVAELTDRRRLGLLGRERFAASANVARADANAAAAAMNLALGETLDALVTWIEQTAPAR